MHSNPGFVVFRFRVPRSPGNFTEQTAFAFSKLRLLVLKVSPESSLQCRKRICLFTLSGPVSNLVWLLLTKSKNHLPEHKSNALKICPWNYGTLWVIASEIFKPRKPGSLSRTQSLSYFISCFSIHSSALVRSSFPFYHSEFSLWRQSKLFNSVQTPLLLVDLQMETISCEYSNLDRFVFSTSSHLLVAELYLKIQRCSNCKCRSQSSGFDLYYASPRQTLFWPSEAEIAPGIPF